MKKLRARNSGSPVYCIKVGYNEKNEDINMWLNLAQTAALWLIFIALFMYGF